MKKIFIALLKEYSKTESGRIEIIRIMNENLLNDYTEQTDFGNVYNYFIEFVLANPFITKCALQKDEDSLRMLKWGIQEEFETALNYITEKDIKTNPDAKKYHRSGPSEK